MDLIRTLEALISEASYSLQWGKAAFVEATRILAHGDFATNLAMTMAKSLETNPRKVAEQLIAHLPNSELIAKVEVAGPGFVNLTLSSKAWQILIQSINSSPNDYGTSNMGEGGKVNVEYVSANPTGPVHIGHVRGAMVGDTLAQVMKKTGFDVVEEYYMNNAGTQTDVLASSTLLRYKQVLGHDIGVIPDGMYPGEYLIEVARQLRNEHGDKLGDGDLHLIKTFAIHNIMEGIKEDLQKLGIYHDVFTSESEMLDTPCVAEAIDELRKRDLIYEDILEKPKGKANDDWVPRKQVLFRSSQFGDSTDRPLTKADGSWTYFAADIGYQYNKIKRGFKNLVMVLGCDHVGYATRIKAATEALEDGVNLKVVFYDIVNLMHGENVVKMSKRKGNFLTAQDVIDVIGADAIRFMMLSRSSEVVLDFDLEKAREDTKDNPVFYIQYAHARACSVLRKGDEFRGKEVDFSLVTTEEERMVLRMLAEWPNTLCVTAEKCEPHRVAFYLQNLAKAFHAFWNAGVNDKNYRCVIPESPVLTSTRLEIVTALTNVIASGLKLLKVKPLESM